MPTWLSSAKPRGAPISRETASAKSALRFLYTADDAAKQFEALLAGREAERGERALGRGDRLVDIRFRAHRDLRERVFVRGIDHVEEFRRRGLDPGAVDVELQFVRALNLPCVVFDLAITVSI